MEMKIHGVPEKIDWQGQGVRLMSWASGRAK